MVQRLSDDIARFEASLDPAVPVLMQAAPYDHTGWERLWRGLGLVAGIVVAVAGLFVVAVVLVIRRLRRRRRRRS